MEIADNNKYSDKDLLYLLYQKGFEFLQAQTDQTIIDVGSIGLAYAIKRIGNTKDFN